MSNYHPSSQPVDLTWSTVAGTASAAGGDYTGVTDAPLVFNAGQTTNNFTVQTLAPPSAQGAESFQVVVQPKAAPGYDLAASTVTIAPSGPVLPNVNVSGIDGYDLPDIINAVGQPFSGDLTESDPDASYNFVVSRDATVTYEFGVGSQYQKITTDLPEGDYDFRVELPSGTNNISYYFAIDSGNCSPPLRWAAGRDKLTR